MPIRNLLFDLGGVIYQIDTPRFQQKVLELGMKSGLQLTEGHRQAFIDTFQAFEKGAYSPDEFLAHLNQEFFPRATAAEIEETWNSILVGVFPGRPQLFARLAENYPLYLLSNTNPIHFEYLLPATQPVFQYFKALYLSYKLGMRKPDEAIFREVTAQAAFVPEETLFIDDTPEHLRTAAELGYQTLHLQEPETLQVLLTRKLAGG